MNRAMKQKAVILFIGFVLLAGVRAVHAQLTFRINTGFKPPISNIYQGIMEDAFQRLGLAVDFQVVAPERSLSLVAQGVDDGDCCRIEELAAHYPTLRRVPVALIDIDFVAFTRDNSIRIQNWADLEPYEVGVVRGWKILEAELAQRPVREIYTLTTPRSMFNMLNKGRIQVATIGRLVGYETIRAMAIPDIEVQEPPLVSRPLYLYLHERHAALIPRFTQVLEQMKQEGSLMKYYRQFTAPMNHGL